MILAPHLEGRESGLKVELWDVLRTIAVDAGCTPGLAIINPAAAAVPAALSCKRLPCTNL